MDDASVVEHQQIAGPPFDADRVASEHLLGVARLPERVGIIGREEVGDPCSR